MSGTLPLALVIASVCAGQPAVKWISLFDGKSLRGWKEAPFRGHGPVSVKDGIITLGRGRMTGITFTGKFPRSGYEVRFEAARMAGNDFFAGLTFPVQDSFCTWINGGWGGTVVGLSSLDGDDASENETSIVRNFDQGRWYAFRLAVTKDRIRAWIDGELVIDADIKDRRVELREGEMELNTPLGFASYATVGSVRKVEYRVLPAI